LDVAASETIRRVKEKIRHKEGFRPSQQRLLMGKWQLRNNYLVSFYNIQKESTLDLALRLRGGKYLYFWIQLNFDHFQDRLEIKR
jgi:hypothetical protein